MKALVDQVDALLTQDPELIALFPALSAELATRYPDGVALYYKMALRDAPMPYVVHLCDLKTPPGDPEPVQAGPYLLDVWDYSPNADRVLAIVARIKQLLSSAYLPVGSSYATLHYVRDRDVQTDAEDVHRIAMEFSAWAYDTATANAVLERT